ncbi:galactokinase [Thermodesulfobacteriota bacterium]
MKQPNYISVKKILEETPVSASAPCRVDSGGTWDIKAMALPFENHRPVTVNMALNLRTTAHLSPFREGRIEVISEGFSKAVQCDYKDIPLKGPFAIFFAAARFFGFHGMRIHIKSDSPVKSALGGSSTALVALIKALSELSRICRKKGLSKRDLLHLGYHIEDGISGGNCGMQDQAAAVYGGVNSWKWAYSNRTSCAVRKKLLDAEGMRQLSKRILVAYSGKSHVSAKMNREWIDNFLNGKTRAGWLEVNAIVYALSSAIKKKRWQEAAGLIREEMKIRKKITPDALIPETEKLIKTAEYLKCGARFTGAGAGGSVWALGESDHILRLREEWKAVLDKINGASILECAIDPKGVF